MNFFLAYKSFILDWGMYHVEKHAMRVWDFMLNVTATRNHYSYQQQKMCTFSGWFGEYINIPLPITNKLVIWITLSRSDSSKFMTLGLRPRAISCELSLSELRHVTRLSKLRTLQWRHNRRDSVSNHQHYDCLLNRLFRRTSKKTPKLRVAGLCAGNSPGTGEFPAQRASNAENASIWWRHHDKYMHFPNYFRMIRQEVKIGISKVNGLAIFSYVITVTS